MDGVERANRFGWKRASHAGENGFSYFHDVAAPDKSLEVEQRRPMLFGRDRRTARVVSANVRADVAR